MLYGRASEQAAVDRLLAGARAGRGGALAIRGEAGIGKTALLEYAAAGAHDMRVLRGTGIESEAELPFAGLHLLLHPFLGRLDALPAPQASALRRAFGLSGGSAAGTERHLIGLATLSLLDDVAADGPVLCLIDDAQWLDQPSAEAVLFAARRLYAEGVAMLFAARNGHPFAASGLAELTLSGLDRQPAAALLADRVADLAPHVRDGIIDSAGGNPLALLELPAQLSSGQRLGQQPLGADDFRSRPVSSRVQQAFIERIRRLPERSRTVLLVAAADDTGDVSVLLEAAGDLGAGVADLEPVEEAALVQVIGTRLAFRHPLVRAVAYQGASLTRRLLAHGALAKALRGVANADRRAWHLASAAMGPDEQVAAELERSARHARSRGGYAAVATAYERAAQLSPDPHERARRLAAAADAADDAGQPVRAGALADQAAPHLDDPLARAQVAQIRANFAYSQGHTRRAQELRVEGAALAVEQSPATAAFMLFNAMTAAWNLGDVDALADIAARLSDLSDTAGVHFLARIAEGLVQLAVGEPRKGIPPLREVIDSTLDPDTTMTRRERDYAGRWYLLVGDLDAAHLQALASEQRYRMQGAIGRLTAALSDAAQTRMFLGQHGAARLSALEGLRIARDIGQPHTLPQLSGVLAYLAAIEGAEEACRDALSEVNGVWRGCALSLLDLGLGRNEAALARLEELDAGGERTSILLLYSLPDLVEAAARHGEPHRAVRAHTRFERWALATGQPWAEAIAARCRAILSGSGGQAGSAGAEDIGETERLFAEAVRLHSQAPRPFERGRTELLYGEWLRRHRRRVDARVRLRSALEIFEQLEARPWADRARAELRATGETPESREHTPGLLDRLTPQEAQVVRLAVTGLSNREIAAQMFLSPRTVGYHLYKAYPKLGVSSRNDLARLDLH